ncbi:MAG TPA: type II toxin-antitoxin system MqsR family toxin [Longimicrobium sp.]|jgi:ABC-type Fe3+ transport system substrate-binding protein
MATKRIPTYDLSEIQRQIRTGRYVVTGSSRAGAELLGLDESDVVACVGLLTRVDFYKSMPSEQVPGMWQDVYRPTYEGRALYVKLQQRGDRLVVVISFKEL